MLIIVIICLASNVIGGVDEPLWKRRIFGIYKSILRKGKNIDDVMITEEATYSSSTQRDMIITLKQAGEFINDMNTKEWIVTDATSNVGGSSLGFATQVKQVNAIEISPETFKCLSNNISLFKVDNVVLYNDDYNNIYKELKQDMIFLDPPWAGTEKIPNSDLMLGNKNLIDVVNDALPNARVIVCKVPKTFNTEKFEKNVKGIVKYEKIYNRNNKVKWINILVKSG